MCGRKLLFPKRSIKMIDGSKEHKCQLLASELQNLCVFEKRSKEEVTQSKNATEDQNRICEYIILSNGPLICKKKIQFTTTNTFNLSVILHIDPCVLSATLHHVSSCINEIIFSFVHDVQLMIHDDQRVGSGKAQKFYKCSYMYLLLFLQQKNEPVKPSVTTVISFSI